VIWSGGHRLLVEYDVNGFGRLSEAQARRMLDFMTRMKVHAFLKARNVYLNYSIQELKNDLENSYLS
jgi:hypothetical protein